MGDSRLLPVHGGNADPEMGLGSPDDSSTRGVLQLKSHTAQQLYENTVIGAASVARAGGVSHESADFSAGSCRPVSGSTPRACQYDSP